MNSTGWGIALGYFDGVHTGHRRLIERLCKQSKHARLRAMILTFTTHPQNVINPGCPISLIYPIQEKYKILCSLGVDKVDMIDFNTRVSQMTPEQFFREVLLEYNVKYIAVGFNYKFGLGGKGDASLLGKLAAQKGIKVDIVKPVMLEGKLISSSFIRQLLMKGSIEKANEYLGRNYRVSGEVVKGKGRGNGMGIPTANIKLPEGILCPARGVYSTSTHIGERVYKSITNIGSNPTFDNDDVSVETHIHGLDKDLYGSYIEVEFFQRIRGERKFNNKEELRRQIELDIRNLGN